MIKKCQFFHKNSLLEPFPGHIEGSFDILGKFSPPKFEKQSCTRNRKTINKGVNITTKCFFPYNVPAKAYYENLTTHPKDLVEGPESFAGSPTTRRKVNFPIFYSKLSFGHIESRFCFRP